MFVEIERARLTRILAKIKEDEGKIAEAADVLQEIQVRASSPPFFCSSLSFLAPLFSSRIHFLILLL
jgi:hypothetical protein